jgi:predicted Rossmann fold nucleotide-binding protein DprA/Smf involved in DNA uptake
MDMTAQIILAALYLRGAPRQFELRRGEWPKVERLMRVRQPQLSEASHCLRHDGLWPEALALGCPDLISWAEQMVLDGRVLTAAHPSYPQIWIDRLGSGAPPALWIHGDLPQGPVVTIVGSRDIEHRERQFSQRCAEEAVALGYSVASGGAKGCDRAAARGTPAELMIEILPYGLEFAGAAKTSCRLSLCAPREDFTGGAAMERNALLYALGEAAVIVHARFKAGGTWHGAVDACRRRLTKLIAREDARNPAHRALIGLGAAPLARPENLRAAMELVPLQPQLVC